MTDKYQLFIDSLVDISKNKNIVLDMNLYLKELNRIGIPDTAQDNFLVFSLIKKRKLGYKIVELSARRIIELNPHFNHFAPLCIISDNGYDYEPFGFLNSSATRKRILDNLIKQSPFSLREYGVYRNDICWFIFIITQEEVNCDKNLINQDVVKEIISFTESILGFEEKYSESIDPYKKYVYFSMLGVCYYKLNKKHDSLKYLNKALNEKVITIVENTPIDKYPYQFGESEIEMSHRYLSEIVNEYYTFFVKNQKDYKRILANAYKLEEIIKAFEYFVNWDPNNSDLHLMFLFIWDIIHTAKKEAQNTDDLLDETALEQYKFAESCCKKVEADQKQSEIVRAFMVPAISLEVSSLIYDIERVKDCDSEIQEIYSKYKVGIEKKRIISGQDRKEMQEQIDSLKAEILIRNAFLDDFKEPELEAEKSLKLIFGIFWDFLEEVSQSYLINADSALKQKGILNTNSKHRIYDEIWRYFLLAMECELNYKIFDKFRNYLKLELNWKYKKIIEAELKDSSRPFLIYLQKGKTLSLGQIGTILKKCNSTKSNEVFFKLRQFITNKCKKKTILRPDFIDTINKWADIRAYIGHAYDPQTSYKNSLEFRNELIGDSNNPGWFLQFLQDTR